jgi:hypothetical protein
MTHVRCVDDSTVSEWKTVCDLLGVVEEKVGISQLSTFQPSHATELARHVRREYGKDPAEWPADEATQWVERCEEEEMTVGEFRAAMLNQRIQPPADDDARAVRG